MHFILNDAYCVIYLKALKGTIRNLKLNNFNLSMGTLSAKHMLWETLQNKELGFFNLKICMEKSGRMGNLWIKRDKIASTMCGFLYVSIQT